MKSKAVPGLGLNDLIFLKISAMSASEHPLLRFNRSNFPDPIRCKFSSITAIFLQ